MKTLNDCWREYRDKVYPHGTLPDQNKQLHQAFFAGAFTALGELKAIGKLTEDDGIKRLEALNREATEVCQAVVDITKGRN